MTKFLLSTKFVCELDSYINKHHFQNQNYNLHHSSLSKLDVYKLQVKRKKDNIMNYGEANITSFEFRWTLNKL